MKKIIAFILIIFYTFSIQAVFAEDSYDYIDFIVNVEDGKEIVVLQLTDTQIIDAAQERFEYRLGSTHEEYWATDKLEDRCFSYIRETIEQTNPDLILITGDLIYGEFDDNGTVLTALIEFMEGFDIPWAPVFGNHDNESIKGVDWQCQQLENAENCLFKQRTLTGNGNYSVGIVQGGDLKRVFFMLDSNGGGTMSDESFSNGHSQKTTGFGEDQIAWYTETAQKIKEDSPNTKISFAFHIQPLIFKTAYEKYGFTNSDTINNPINIDEIEDAADGDFGYIGRDLKGAWDSDFSVYEGMKALGADSIFVGHEHCNSASVVYDGIRFQFGQKSSTYDRANYVKTDGTITGSYDPVGDPLVGGTVMKLSADGSIGDAYIYYCNTAIDANIKTWGYEEDFTAMDVGENADSDYITYSKTVSGDETYKYMPKRTVITVNKFPKKKCVVKMNVVTEGYSWFRLYNGSNHTEMDFVAFDADNAGEHTVLLGYTPTEADAAETFFTVENDTVTNIKINNIKVYVDGEDLHFGTTEETEGTYDPFTYIMDFENFTAGTYTQEKLTELTPGFSWFNKANIVEDENGKHLNTSNDTYLIFPENSRKVVIGAKMRSADFTANKFPMHFSGGGIDDTLVYNTGIFGPNWPAGLGLIPSNSSPMKDPDSITLSAGWNGQLSENDNAVYVYKNEWFYAKIEYDYTTKTFKVYYSYDGDKYYEVYSKVLELSEGYEMRSVRLSENMDFDDISIMCDTDSIYDIYIKNADGEVIDSVTDEKSFSIYGGIYNYNNRLTEDITTVVAIYDKTSGKLLEAKIDKASFETASDVCLGNFELEYNDENSEIRFFAFKSLETLVPCCQSKQLK